MKLYLSGPMSGLPDLNRPAFKTAAEQLRAAGYSVVNPAVTHVEGWDWDRYMRLDIKKMMRCDGVALLDGWETSRGATIEYDLAMSLRWPVKTVYGWMLDGEAS